MRSYTTLFWKFGNEGKAAQLRLLGATYDHHFLHKEIVDTFSSSSTEKDVCGPNSSPRRRNKEM